MRQEQPNLMSQVGVMRLTAALLELGATKFDEAGHNPLDLRQFMPRVEDRRAMMSELYEWDGTPELFDPRSEYDVAPDGLLARWIAAQVQDRVEAILAGSA